MYHRDVSGVFGRGLPFCRGLPLWPGCRGSGGSNRLASSRRRLMSVACVPMVSASSCVPKLLSPTKMIDRFGNQRMIMRMPCRALSVSVFVTPSHVPGPLIRRGKEGQDWQCLDARQPGQWCQQHEAEPSQSAGLDEMAMTGPHGGHGRSPRARMRAPQRRSIVSSRPMMTGSVLSSRCSTSDRASRLARSRGFQRARLRTW